MIISGITGFAIFQRTDGGSPRNIVFFGDYHMPGHREYADINILELLQRFTDISNTLYVIEWFEDENTISTIDTYGNPREGKEIVGMIKQHAEDLKDPEIIGELASVCTTDVLKGRNVVYADERRRALPHMESYNRIIGMQFPVTRESVKQNYVALSKAHNYMARKEVSLFGKYYTGLFDRLKKCSHKLFSILRRKLIEIKKNEQLILDDYKALLNTQTERYDLQKKLLEGTNIEKLSKLWRKQSVLSVDNSPYTISKGKRNYTVLKHGKKIVPIPINNRKMNSMTLSLYRPVPFLLNNNYLLLVGLERLCVVDMNTRQVGMWSFHTGFISIEDDFVYFQYNPTSFMRVDKRSGQISPVVFPSLRLLVADPIPLYAMLLDVSMVSYICDPKYNHYKNMIVYAGAAHLNNTRDLLVKSGLYKPMYWTNKLEFVPLSVAISSSAVRYMEDNVGLVLKGDKGNKKGKGGKEEIGVYKGDKIAVVPLNQNFIEIYPDRRKISTISLVRSLSFNADYSLLAWSNKNKTFLYDGKYDKSILDRSGYVVFNNDHLYISDTNNLYRYDVKQGKFDQLLQLTQIGYITCLDVNDRHITVAGNKYLQIYSNNNCVLNKLFTGTVRKVINHLHNVVILTDNCVYVWSNDLKEVCRSPSTIYDIACQNNSIFWSINNSVYMYDQKGVTLLFSQEDHVHHLSATKNNLVFTQKNEILTYDLNTKEIDCFQVLSKSKKIRMIAT